MIRGGAFNSFVAEFADPALRFGTDSRHRTAAADPPRIHPDYLHGEGMFGAQVLTYDLQEDACHAFDEALCATTPLRPTSAMTALRRG